MLQQRKELEQITTCSSALQGMSQENKTNKVRFAVEVLDTKSLFQN